jgi:hypothetical protein
MKDQSYIENDIHSVKLSFKFFKEDKEVEVNDILFYSTLEENQIFRNWLNHLYLIHSLGQRKSEELKSWVDKIGKTLRVIKFKKEN